MSTETTPTERPAPGRLDSTLMPDWQGRWESYELARDGRVAESTIAALTAAREKAANELHYSLRDLSRVYDRAAVDLEAGKRRWVLPGSQRYAEVPVLMAALNAACESLEEATDRVRYVEGDLSVEAQAYRLDQAADVLDKRVTALGLNGTDPTADALRREATEMRDYEAARVAAVQREATAKREAEKARRTSKPLGARERTLLADGLRVGQVVAVRESERKARTLLVERGLVKREAAEAGSRHEVYRLTERGTEVAQSAEVTPAS